MRVLLEARALSIGYAGRSLGSGLDLQLQAGEVLALLGANGSGKTTFLKTLLGLLPPLAGEVRLCGRPLASLPPRERARLLAYVPQAVGQGFAFSVLDMVLMGRAAHLDVLARPGRHDREAALQVLQQLGIESLAQQSWLQLSGGQQQLVLLARALMQQPRVLLLDEPTASLDFANQILVLERLAGLREQGLAVLFTTHQPEHALQLADRLALFRAGSLQLLDSPGQLDVERLAWLYDLQPEQIRRHLAVGVRHE